MTKKFFVYFVLIVAIGTVAWALLSKGGEKANMDVLNASETPMPDGDNDGTQQEPETITTAEGLQYQDLVVGEGAQVITGNRVAVHYTGWLTDGTKFDSSLDRGEPFVFTVGAGEVIQGWDLGVAGMRVGGKRRLTIPSQLGYGDRGAGGVIPPAATLVFEVEVLDTAQ